MIAVTLLLDRELALAAPVCLPETRRSVTGRHGPAATDRAISALLNGYAGGWPPRGAAPDGLFGWWPRPPSRRLAGRGSGSVLARLEGRKGRPVWTGQHPRTRLRDYRSGRGADGRAWRQEAGR